MNVVGQNFAYEFSVCTRIDLATPIIIMYTTLFITQPAVCHAHTAGGYPI